MKIFWTLKAMAMYLSLTWPFARYSTWVPVRNIEKSRPGCTLEWINERGNFEEKHPIFCRPFDAAVRFKLWIGNDSIPTRRGFK